MSGRSEKYRLPAQQNLTKQIDARPADERAVSAYGYTSLDRWPGSNVLKSGIDPSTGQRVRFNAQGMPPEMARAQGVPATPFYGSAAEAALDHPTGAEAALTRPAQPAPETPATTANTTAGQASSTTPTFTAPDPLGTSNGTRFDPAATNTAPASADSTLSGTITGRQALQINAPAPQVLAGTAADSAAAVRTMGLANLAKTGAPDPLGTGGTPVSSTAQGYASGGNFNTAAARTDLNAGRITPDQYGQVINAASAAGNAQPGVSDASRASLETDLKLARADEARAARDAQARDAANVQATHERLLTEQAAAAAVVRKDYPSLADENSDLFQAAM